MGVSTAWVLHCVRAKHIDAVDEAAELQARKFRTRIVRGRDKKYRVYFKLVVKHKGRNLKVRMP